MRDPSLDQLRVFSLVAAEGSFSAAARVLGRAQSAVTYAIQNLESECGLLLFDRTGYRPQLTEAGRALLVRAQAVLEASGAFVAVSDGLRTGLESELSLVIEAMFPMARLVDVLREFQSLFPSVQTRLQIESLGAARDAVVDRGADIGLIIPAEGAVDTLHLAAVAEIELAAVAAPEHPLAVLSKARNGAALEPDELRQHLQLVFSDRSTRGRWPDRGVLSPRTWRLADLGAKHSMLLAGLGWGSMPLHIIEEDLKQGRLVRLTPASWDGGGALPRLPLAAAYRRDRVLGQAGQWLFERLRADSRARPEG